MNVRRSASALFCVGLFSPLSALAEEPVEIEVRGAAMAKPSKDPSVAGNVIRRERLQAPGLQASDVLRTQPGVSVVETGGYSSPSTASLRGASAAQTPVYLAGVRLNDDVGGAADLGQVPIWFLNRIEIYRSHAPVAGDQLGLGGAIFLEPRKPRGPEATLGGMLGSFGARALYGSAGIGNEKSGALVGVRVDGAENDYTFENDNGTRFDPSQAHEAVLQNADVSRLEVWGVGSVKLGEGARAELVLNDAEREQGAPSLALFGSLRARVRASRRLAAVTTRASCGAHCRVSTTSSALWTQSRYDDPLRELGLGGTSLTLRGERTEHSLALDWGASERFSLNPTVHFALERLQQRRPRSPELNARRSFGRAALQARFRVAPRWALVALGSAECHGTTLNGNVPWAAPGDVAELEGRGACGERETSGRLGATWEGSWFELSANAGRYARVPTLTELFGASEAVRGNTELEPERGISLELGARSSAAFTSRLEGLAFDVFGFVRSSESLIGYQRASVGYVRPYNVGSARVLGLEAQLSYRPLSVISAEIAVTLQDPRDTSEVRPARNVLPHRARFVVAPRLELRSRARSGAFNRARLAASYLYQAERFADRANLIVLPAQGSLELEGELTFSNERLATSLRVANALDQTRFDLIGYPLPGRAAYVALEIRL